MRIAYFDLAHGLSGDMAMASLAHAGRRLQIDVETAITEAVATLGLECTVSFVDDERAGIACIRAEVKTDGTTHSSEELRAAIGRADVDEPVRSSALKGLDALVGAEAAVHGCAPEDVALHELGSADTAADLVGAFTGLNSLGIEAVFAAPVPVSRGWIKASHGRLPVPAPVTLELLRGSRLRGVDEEGELVTPTGAAILVASAANFGAMPEMEAVVTGLGAGTRITDIPNISRVVIGETASATIGARAEGVVLLETNIDDQTPQSLARAIEVLMSAGALDAWVTPIVMKKSRAALALSVLIAPSDEAAITETIFRETTTLGVRRRDTTRWALEREELTVRVGDSSVRVKVARLDGDVVNVAPEFDDCVVASELSGEPLDGVRQQALAAAEQALDLD